MVRWLRYPLAFAIAFAMLLLWILAMLGLVLHPHLPESFRSPPVLHYRVAYAVWAFLYLTTACAAMVYIGRKESRRRRIVHTGASVNPEEIRIYRPAFSGWRDNTLVGLSAHALRVRVVGVSYTFSASDGRLFEGRDIVVTGFFDDAVLRRSVRVHYDVGEPEVNVAELQETR